MLLRCHSLSRLIGLEFGQNLAVPFQSAVHLVFVDGLFAEEAYRCEGQ